MDIGKRIRTHREAKGLTQVQLAQASGLHEISVCLIETGKRQPKPETVAKLAAALGCSPIELDHSAPADAPIPDMTAPATDPATAAPDAPESDRRIA